MRKIQVNGIDMAYKERGKGYPLMLIMGLGADKSLWEAHVRAFDKHFRCIMMDNRGAGFSGKPAGPYSTAMMAADAVGLMDALHIDQAHILGISMGGAITQSIALAYPERVRSIVLVSSWARCDRYLKTFFESLQVARTKLNLAEFRKMLQLWTYTPQYFESDFETLLGAQKLAAKIKNPMPPDAFAAQCDACIAHDTLEQLMKINVPVLITVGNADIFTPMRFSEEIHNRISNSKLVIFQGLGHVHHWEDLKRFNSVVTDFLLENTGTVNT